MHSSQMNTDGPGDELSHLVLALAAEGAIEKLVAGGLVGHQSGNPVWECACDADQAFERYPLEGLYPPWARFCKTWSTIPYSLACFGGEEIVTVVVALDLLRRASGELRHQLDEPPLQVDHELRVALDVRHLALEAAGRLVDQDRRIGQREALALGAGGEQERAHRRRHADAERGHVRLDELHRVEDRHARRDRAARRVDVEVDVLVRVFGLEEQHLRDDEVGGRLVDRARRGR